jgi:hypothetical protein
MKKVSGISKSLLFFALCVLLLAGSLQLFAKRMDFEALLEIPPCFRIGGPLHHYFEPGCQGVSRSGIEYVINEDALRDRPRQELGQGAVMVLGDSLVEGKGLAFADTISQKLESRFGRTFINAGVRSRGPVIQSLALQELIGTYEPSFLLWVLNENDVDDDKLAYALQTESDENGVPVTLGTEDFDRVAWIGGLRSRIGGLGGILDFLVYASYARAVKDLVDRPETGFEACGGINRGLRIADEGNLPVLLAITPLGPNNPHRYLEKNFQKLIPCLDSRRVVDLRVPLSPDLYLPKDTHFNSAGVDWLADSLMEPLRAALPPAR